MSKPPRGKMLAFTLVYLAAGGLFILCVWIIWRFIPGVRLVW